MKLWIKKKIEQINHCESSVYLISLVDSQRVIWQMLNLSSILLKQIRAWANRPNRFDYHFQATQFACKQELTYRVQVSFSLGSVSICCIYQNGAMRETWPDKCCSLEINRLLQIVVSIDINMITWNIQHFDCSVVRLTIIDITYVSLSVLAPSIVSLTYLKVLNFNKKLR